MVKVPPQPEEPDKVDQPQSPSTEPNLPRSDGNLHPPNENPMPLDGNPPSSESSALWKYGKYALPVVAGGAAVVGAPIVISTVGFKAGGIAAGSTAAKMMSAGALANGGGVASGGVVATLQSAGALGGLSAGASTALGTGAGAATAGTQVLGSYLTQPGKTGDAEQSTGNEKPTNHAASPTTKLAETAHKAEQQQMGNSNPRSGSDTTTDSGVQQLVKNYTQPFTGVIGGAVGGLSAGASFALSTVTGVATAGTQALGSYLTQPGKTGDVEMPTKGIKPTNDAEAPANPAQMQAKETEQSRTGNTRTTGKLEQSVRQQMENGDPTGSSVSATDGGVKYLVKNFAQPFTGVIVGAVGSLSAGASAAMSTVTGVATAGTQALGSYLTQPGKTGDVETPTNGEKQTNNTDMPTVRIQTKNTDQTRTSAITTGKAEEPVRQQQMGNTKTTIGSNTKQDGEVKPKL